MKAIIVACTLLEHNQKYLLIQQARGRRQPGKWGPSGGKPDIGETLTEAAIRETSEEIGRTVELTGFLGIIRSGHLNEPNLFVCFAGKLQNASDAENLVLKDGEISGARWLSIEEIEAGIVPLRATPFANIFRRFHTGQVYPLELVQHEALDKE